MKTIERKHPAPEGHLDWGYAPLAGLGGKAPERLPFAPNEDNPVRDVRGDWIGCEEAARIVDIGRTQMWRLADTGKIPCVRFGTQTEDLKTVVQDRDEESFVIPKKLSKKWDLRPIRVGRRSVQPTGIDHIEIGRDTTFTRIWVAGGTEEIGPEMPVTIPAGKLGRPEYKFERAEVIRFASLRRSVKKMREIGKNNQALRELLAVARLCEMETMVRQAVRSTRRHGAVNPLQRTASERPAA